MYLWNRTKLLRYNKKNAPNYENLSFRNFGNGIVQLLNYNLQNLFLCMPLMGKQKYTKYFFKLSRFMFLYLNTYCINIYIVVVTIIH